MALNNVALRYEPDPYPSGHFDRDGVYWRHPITKKENPDTQVKEKPPEHSESNDERQNTDRS